MAIGEEHLNLLEKTICLIEKYGIFKILKALLLLVTTTYLIFNISKMDEIVEHAIVNREAERVIEHDNALEVRRSIKPEIDLILKQLLADLNGDRVFIIEMHNGTNNTAGLPFIYGEMTYSVVRDGVTHIDEDYTNLNLCRFDFPLHMEEKHMWLGTIEELQKIDAKLAARLMSNDVTYLGIITIHGSMNEIGYLGVTYCDKDKQIDKNKIVEKITIASQRLSALLSSENIEQ